MKKVILLFALMLTGLTTATAAENTSATLERDLDFTSRYRYAQPIMFVERGVEFLIFADGSFDFNTDYFGNSPRQSKYYRRRGQNINRSFGAPGTQSRHFGSRNRGVRITHDYLGRVKRVGNVFLNYDRLGRIKRAGTVYMQYKHRRLKQVGDLRLKYNKRGRLVDTFGYVNYDNRHMNNCINNNSNYYDFNDNFNDNDFYYYRQNNITKKHKKLKKRYRDD